MGIEVFLGKPPPNIEQWIKDHYGPVVKETTVVKYTIASGLPDWEGDIVGELTNESIPNKSDIAEVEIGSHVTSIGGSAFESCSGLTSVMIPDSVTEIRIGAFFGCIGLTSVTIPNRVTIIDQMAFTNCTNLTSVAIPDSVENIKDEAFSGCSGLTSVTIGNGVTYIDYDAFYNCTAVNDVYCYPNPANLTWTEGDKDDFKTDGSTRCHVKAEYLTAYQSKFGGEVNVTFVGDLI